MIQGPTTVLVVDDEEPIRTALRKYLTQQGYEVSTAADGDEALAILQRQKIACMLLDVRLPGTSGVDLVPKVLEIEPNIALLMLTAVNDATSAALCMQRGAMDYLTKPIDLADLDRAIQRALQRRTTMLEQQNSTSGSRKRWPCGPPRSGASGPSWSGSRSPPWKRWSTRSRPRIPTCGGTPPASPTSPP